MKIKYCDSHGTPAFSVVAENEQDKELLSHFINYGEKNREDYTFWLHSSSYTEGKTISFFFGYINLKQMKKYTKRSNVLVRVWKAIREG